MILAWFSWLFAGSALVALLCCLALGLLHACQFIESHAATSRRAGLRLTYASIVLQISVILLDDVPLSTLLPNLLCCLVHLYSLSPVDWPFHAAPSSLANMALSVLLPLSSHLLLARHHKQVSHGWHLHRYDQEVRPRLAGGRLDWDVSPHPPDARELSLLELFALLGFGVWMVPIWRFLGGMAGAEWHLPLSSRRG